MKSIQYAKIAHGDMKADLVLKNCQIVNVFSGEIEQGDIAITDGIIMGIGAYKGEVEFDVKNKFVAPGFIDGHVHIESSMLTPPQFAKIVMPKGTTTVIADPHEIANISGIEGIKYMLESSRRVPLDVLVMVPSCVPATSFETSGYTISSSDIEQIRDYEGVLGLGEVMNYPGVIYGDKEVHNKLDAMKGKIKDGHAPNMEGHDLNAYIVSGIKTDHECTTVSEMEEKIKRGMYILLREGSATRNVSVLSKGVNPKNSRRLLFCTDDKHPEDIKNEGHINYNIRLAIQNGVDPITAIQMATINTATCYQLDRIGAIAPSYYADLVVFQSLEEIDVDLVFKRGYLVAKKNRALFESKIIHNPKVLNTVNIDKENISFDLRLTSNKVKVIQLIVNNVTTTKVIREVKTKSGIYVHDQAQDILKLAVVERHHKTGNIGLGLVEGYGLQNGAIAMTIAHDSHNLIIIGDNDIDMMVALQEIDRIQGGIALVSKGVVLDSLQLECGGIMTNQDVKVVESKIKHMEELVRKMGVSDRVDDPFLSLAFLSLPVIPELKLTDKGLFDVTKFELVNIEEE
ncbi:MAG: adenine deaminase [Bacilli bacterium]|nr:adenine deaminase [Bacilli bacterium]